MVYNCYMNSNQEKVLLSTTIIVLVMALFPPLKFTTSGGRTLSSDYYWIFSDYPYGYSIDIVQLLTQIIIVISIGVILFLLLKSKDNI